MKNDLYKYLLCIICLSYSLALSAQTKQEAVLALKEGVAATNKLLPLQAAFFTMQKMEINANEYIVYMTIDESQQNLDEYIQNMNKYKSNIFALVSGQRQEFAELFITSGLNLRFQITGNRSKKLRQIFLSASEIKNSFGKNYSPKDFIKDYIVEQRKALPEEWGDGLTLTGIDIEDSYICYRVKTDETFLTIPLLQRSKAEGHEMEDSIMEELNNNKDPMVRTFINYVIQSGLGIKYVYWSEKNADTVSFTISSYTLKTKVQLNN
jgi:hypothetical protein